jgi:hypothetical protein
VAVEWPEGVSPSGSRRNAPHLPDFFSATQRKVISPNDLTNLNQLEQRLADFEQRYNATARPFKWKFTLTDLDHLLARIDQQQQQTTSNTIPQAA